MVMTGATTMMNGAGPGMMGPGVMMDMSGMMGPMSMGMNGDMSMGGAMMQGMMQDGGQGQQQGVGIIQGSGTPEQGAGAVSMMQDGFNAGAAAGGMMNMGIGGEYGMQVRSCLYSGLEYNYVLIVTCRNKTRWCKSCIPICKDPKPLHLHLVQDVVPLKYHSEVGVLQACGEEASPEEVVVGEDSMRMVYIFSSSHIILKQLDCVSSSSTSTCATCLSTPTWSAHRTS